MTLTAAAGAPVRHRARFEAGAAGAAAGDPGSAGDDDEGGAATAGKSSQAAGSGGASPEPTGASGATCTGGFEFDQVSLDDDSTGECKALGDIDGDGFLDVVVGGYELEWYEYPSWQSHHVATADTEFIGHMQAGDINNDGAIDLVLPDGDYVYWFEIRPAAAGTWTTSGRGTWSAIRVFGLTSSSSLISTWTGGSTSSPIAT